MCAIRGFTRYLELNVQYNIEFGRQGVVPMREGKARVD